MFWGLSVYCGCKRNYLGRSLDLMQVVFNTIITCFSSLSVTRVTTLWLKQSPCSWSVRTTQRTVTEYYRHPPAIYYFLHWVHGLGYNHTGADFLWSWSLGWSPAGNPKRDERTLHASCFTPRAHACIFHVQRRLNKNYNDVERMVKLVISLHFLTQP